jgi:hypothetical protein
LRQSGAKLLKDFITFDAAEKGGLPENREVLQANCREPHFVKGRLFGVGFDSRQRLQEGALSKIGAAAETAAHEAHLAGQEPIHNTFK